LINKKKKKETIDELRVCSVYIKKTGRQTDKQVDRKAEKDRQSRNRKTGRQI
jgi:hypothetical protein